MKPCIFNGLLAGEGEIPGAINVNLPHVTRDSPFSRDGTKKLRDVMSDKDVLIHAPMDNLPFPSGTIDKVVTNNVQIGGSSHLGAFPQADEIKRVLSPGGKWLHNGVEQVFK